MPFLEISLLKHDTLSLGVCNMYCRRQGILYSSVGGTDSVNKSETGVAKESVNRAGCLQRILRVERNDKQTNKILFNISSIHLCTASLWCEVVIVSKQSKVNIRTGACFGHSRF